MKRKLFKSLFALTALTATLVNPFSLTSNSAYAKSTSLNKSINITSPINLANNGTSIPSSTLKSWGLGTLESEYVSNNKPYSWYIDQGNTGTYSNNNCGPSSTTMALKWYYPNFSKTAEDARNTYLENGGWWKTSDVTNYLSLNNANYSVVNNTGESLLKYNLQQGNILILCVDTSYLNYNSNQKQRVGRFYDYEGGHFIVVKGYIVVDGKTYFETYDPNNWDETYSDGQPKGKDRYYASQQLMNAMSNWWNYAIVVDSNSGSMLNISNIMSNDLTQNKISTKLNPNKIKIAYGK
ncbi:cysteine peptidase family C39 domain-containing protein [Clostridium hydrogenum]|uniref:hypothetical protein n=1 Tax=Clostridium hydrogenum TaxID=2855764 RepID=UPI001F4214C5|nr:hypothetical protein [Clostridium hydrogenum]